MQIPIGKEEEITPMSTEVPEWETWQRVMIQSHFSCLGNTYLLLCTDIQSFQTLENILLESVS